MSVGRRDVLPLGSLVQRRLQQFPRGLGLDAQRKLRQLAGRLGAAHGGQHPDARVARFLRGRPELWNLPQTLPGKICYRGAHFRVGEFDERPQ